MTDKNNMQAFMEHIQAELDKLPPPRALDAEAMAFANAYHEYVQEAGDDGDMLYIMVSRLMDEHRAKIAAIKESADFTGCFTGLRDCEGSKVYFGDTLDFDTTEWGEPFIFKVEYDPSNVTRASDIRAWCKKVKGGNSPNPYKKGE